MLRSETLFGKRDNNTSNSASSSAAPSIGGAAARPAVPPVANHLGSAAATPAAAGSNAAGSKLIVGPNIKLKGVEITDCDTLVVEGMVEATIDSRMIQIAERGSFKGSAEIDIAEIHGEFDGQLTVRKKLVIHATGKVSGKISYGKLVVEEGGQLSGEVLVGVGGAVKGLSVAKAS